ncbi:MAG: hypothetical protein ABI769_13130 [Pseudomonadota bacterium]
MSAVQPLMPARYAGWVALSGFANAAVSASCAAIALPLLVAVLGVERYGQWAVLGLFVTTAAALDLGLSRALVLQCAAQPPARVREFATAAALIAGVVAACAVGALVFAALTGFSFGLAEGVMTPAIAMAGASILALGMLNAVMRAVLESQMAVHWVNLGYLLQTALLYGFTLAAALLWPAALLPASVAAFGLVAILNASLLSRLGVLAPRRPKRAALDAMLASTRESFLLAVPTAFLPPLTAFLALSHSTGPAQYAVFDLALRIATLGATLLSGLAVPMLAAAARSRATGGTEAALDRLTIRYLAVGWSLLVAGILVYTLVGARLVAWVFPAAGPGLYPIAGVLLAGMGVLAASEGAIRAVSASSAPGPVFWARLAILALVAGAGGLAWSAGGMKAFATTYALASVAGAAVVLGAWIRRRPPTSGRP